ncbi:MAG: ZmpA/ZmpB/ZmpC family metallo-endopeptidase-related protein [Candidatus Diapherotrites archaeon]|nr:ZmpA/ZmpB/ZmpC family metallo-endopeptidase-related protein [Candidatus Diapherotrites archaeon]
MNFALLSTGTSCQCTAQETTKSCTFTINYTQGGEAKTMDIPTSITCNPTTSIYTPQTITNPNTFTNSATSTTTQLILTTAGLQGISSNLSASYMLFDNVDLTGVTFTPIGNITIPFTGTLDGAGNTISNLTINSPASSYLGLFGVVSGGTVKNITLANTSITGFQYLGGITGYLTGASTISNTKVSGSVTGNPNGTFFSSDGNTIGGLVGLSNTGATITNSSSSSTVTGYRNIGGLIGVNKGIVDYCSASGNVSGIIYTGGLIGSNIDTTVTNSFATGRVSGLDRGFSINNITYGGIGGLIGANTNSRISSSYATGDVNGLTSFIGGLIGRNDSSSPISNTYATGNVKASNLYPPSNISSAGGLIGVSRGSVVSNSYATGTVETYQAAGGLIGNQEDGSVVNSFATGVVKSLSGYCNGLVATVYYTAFVTGSYWYYVSPSCGGACYENRNTVKLNDGCTKKTDKSWFYYDSNGPMSTWDSAIWDLTICNGKNFPHLKMENKTTC